MDAPSTPPHEAVKKGAGKGLSALKKLPPWAWILIAGGFLLVVIYMRHQAASAGSTSTAATASDPNSSDTTDTQGFNGGYASDGYDTGYQQGLTDSGLLGGGGAGAATGTLPSPVGTDGGTTATTQAPYPLQIFTGDMLASQGALMPTGGGAPNKPNVHTGLSVLTGNQKKAGDIALKAGPSKPSAPKGYTVKGTGSGNWVAVKNPPKKKAKPVKRKGP